VQLLTGTGVRTRTDGKKTVIAPLPELLGA
jgi:hypothetical protein